MKDYNTNDKRELLKLRQGLVDKKDSFLEVEKPPIYEKPTGKAAVAHFFYYHKIQLALAAFFIFVAAVFVYSFVSREKADITILLIADDDGKDTSAFFLMEQKKFEVALETFTPDFDNNGKVHAQTLFIDLVKEGRAADYIHGNTTKLFGEIQGGQALILIGNKNALEAIPASGEVALEDFYCDFDELGFFIPVKNTGLALFDYEYMEMPDDLYIAVRISANDYLSANALAVVENIVKSRHVQ
jgi:hypothetical protein